MKPLLNLNIKAILLSLVFVVNFGLSNSAMAVAPVAAPIDLAKAPLATSSSTVVKPNLLFILDNSGSMDWDHMPDDSSDGGSNVPFNFGYYGLRSSQCNQVYYDPNTTYIAPIKADKTSYPDAVFISASNGLQGGYAATPTAVNLNNGYKATQSMNTDATAGSAYYYEYSGAQTTQLQKNYNDTANTFYSECHSNQNATPGNTVFSIRRLATTITTPITVTSSSVSTPTSSLTVASSVNGAPSATITVSAAGTVSTLVNNIKVNGTTITSGSSIASSNSSTIANNVAAKINAFTATAGYSALVSGSVITINGPAGAATFTPVVTRTPTTAGSFTFTATQFTAAKTVSSIKVNGVELLSSAASTSATRNTTASNIAANINANTSTSGFSASVSGSRVDITGPVGASGFTPVITSTAGSVTFSPSPVAFTSGTAVSSILVYGVQLLSSPATASSTDSVTASNIASKINASSGTTGFSATSSSNVITVTGPPSAINATPVIASVAGLTFTTDVFPDNTPAKLTNFANWYSYYRTRMLMMKTATGRAFSGLVDTDYRVGLMKISASSTPTVPLDLFTGTHRSDWYTALYNTNTSGSTPLRTALSDAGKYYAHKLAGADPVQYSCQQNFSILSTDGYWNQGDGSDLNGALVGNQDGTEVPPRNDGYKAATSTVTPQTRYIYSILAGSAGGCSASKSILQYQMQTRTSTITNGIETLTSWVNSGGLSTAGNSCKNTVTLPNPNPSLPQSGTATTVGGSPGTSDNLADVAMFYYKTDLRTSALGNCTGALGTVCSAAVPDPYNNVFSTSKDELKTQHMTTFTLGLGASGYMNYSPSYISSPNEGDFGAVNQSSVASATVCTWQTAGTICTWPVPGMSGSDGLLSNIDDLWHAAVNGHGAYFSATDPSSLSLGLSNALAAINARKGSSAAAATSTLNPVPGNNLAYVASYNTVAWTGNLEARGVNTTNGEVNQNALWCVENVLAGTCDLKISSVVTETVGNTDIAYCVTPSAVTCTGGVWEGSACKIPVATACVGKMAGQAAGTSTPRKIWTKSPGGVTPASLDNFHIAGGVLNAADFSAAKLNGTSTSWSDGLAHSGLNQWSTLNVTQQGQAVGEPLVNYLRGQRDHEINSNNADDNQVFRFREAVFGDAIESQPAFIGKPTFSYTDSGYSSFVTSHSSRPSTVYIGANDGMFHAFDAADNTTNGGMERWAYVPSMLIPKMFALASDSYGSNHAYYANGSPIISDINDGGVWKTILVAGLNGGGRGYYALDITDPTNPKQLWEFTTAVDTGNPTFPHDANLGYTFGNPVITKRADGTWVVLVTSGYNNIPDVSPLVKYPLVNTGDGKGYLYILNAATGQILSTLPTGVGSTAVPSGLAQIATWSDDPEKNNTATFTYGGDLLGNVWRFDINRGPSTGANPNPALFAVLKANGVTQAITTRPELGKVLTSDGKAHQIVYIGTGKYLESSDLADVQQQTYYGIKDDDTLTSTTPTPALVDPRSSTGTGPNHMVQQVLTSGIDSRTITSNAVDFKADRGWFVDFKDPGERQNVASQLVLGTLLVPTTVPSNSVCSPGGTSWLNYFNYKNGGAVSSNGLASTAMTAPIVGINVMYITDPITHEISPVVSTVTADDPTPKLTDGVPFNPPGAGFQKKRVIWRELIQ
jgi:type IV pilus assembly protein PilY1